MTIKVTAYAERDSREKCVIKVTEATIVYVALDKNRKPRPVDNQLLLNHDFSFADFPTDKGLLRPQPFEQLILSSIPEETVL